MPCSFDPAIEHGDAVRIGKIQVANPTTSLRSTFIKGVRGKTRWCVEAQQCADSTEHGAPYKASNRVNAHGHLRES
jgi:hypothetical protein